MPSKGEGFAASQQVWKNKHEFLNLKLKNIDSHLRPRQSQSVQSPPATQGHATGVPLDPPPPYTEMRSR